jgi:hypothetical protein
MGEYHWDERSCPLGLPQHSRSDRAGYTISQRRGSMLDRRLESSYMTNWPAFPLCGNMRQPSDLRIGSVLCWKRRKSVGPENDMQIGVMAAGIRG